jgi:hypothetical protein
MNWIQKANERMRNSILSKKEAGITEKVIKRKQASFEGGIANKGRKHSEETKKVWSERKCGKKLPKEQVEKSRIGIIQTKWEQLLKKYPEDDIKNAIQKHDNHQRNICKELGCSFYTIKKLCKHYGIALKVKSNKEKTEWAIQNQSEKIMVYQCSKREPYRPVGKPKTFYSVRACCNAFTPKLHKGNMLRNMRNGTPYRNMFFKK